MAMEDIGAQDRVFRGRRDQLPDGRMPISEDAKQ